MKTYTVEEIEKMLTEADSDGIPIYSPHSIIRQLLSERTETKKRESELLNTLAMMLHVADYEERKRLIDTALRSKAEQEIGNGGRIDDNNPNDISA